ncbi:hypothetical protein GJV08_02170 [Enterobacteriaceae bacterium RIT692]|nr:hypothetical protein [Enterobacteriaceae bacterium RIT692]
MNKPVDINLLKFKNAPVLLLDTCVLLDIIRDVTRESVQAHNVIAGLELLRKAESGEDLFILIAPQVQLELSDNESDVELESERALKTILSRIKNVDSISFEYGSAVRITVSHLDDYVLRAKKILERWKNVSFLVPQNTDVVDRAFIRVTKSITPARKGKDSIKDCVVTETYLDIAQDLRAKGLTAPIVFASSNTKDYCHAKNLAVDLEQEFSKFNIKYSPNLGAAKHLLGL